MDIRILARWNTWYSRAFCDRLYSEYFGRRRTQFSEKILIICYRQCNTRNGDEFKKTPHSLPTQWMNGHPTHAKTITLGRTKVNTVLWPVLLLNLAGVKIWERWILKDFEIFQKSTLFPRLLIPRKYYWASDADVKRGRFLVCGDLYTSYWMTCSPTVWRNMLVERRTVKLR